MSLFCRFSCDFVEAQKILSLQITLFQHVFQRPHVRSHQTSALQASLKMTRCYLVANVSAKVQIGMWTFFFSSLLLLIFFSFLWCMLTHHIKMFVYNHYMLSPVGCRSDLVTYIIALILNFEWAARREVFNLLLEWYFEAVVHLWIIYGRPF